MSTDLNGVEMFLAVVSALLFCVWATHIFSHGPSVVRVLGLIVSGCIFFAQFKVAGMRHGK